MDNAAQKKHTNIIIYLVLAVLILGAGGFAFMKYTARNEALKYLVIEFNENDVNETVQLEYDLSAFDPLSIVKNHMGNLEVSKSAIDLSVLGECEVEYLLSTVDSMGGAVRKSVTRKFVVVDTQAPVIEFAKEKVSMTKGDKEPNNKIVVKDPVDGELEPVETAPKSLSESEEIYEKGWYTVTSNVDPSTLGEYTVTIHACDRHGNHSENSYTVVVEEQKYTYKGYIYTGAGVAGDPKAFKCDVLSIVNDYLSGKYNYAGWTIKIKNKKRSKYTSLEQIVNDGLYIDVNYGEEVNDYYVYIYNNKGKLIKKYHCLSEH